jgi:tetratricopeptide (TPR) repeat protein
MSREMPWPDGHDGTWQSATASGGSQINQAGRDVINMGGFGWDGPRVSVRPPVERLAQGPKVCGRQPLLDELARVLDDRAAAPRVRVLHGLGGVGKTCAALAAAGHARSRGIPAWWIPATTPDAVAQGMRSVAVELGLNPAALGARHPADALWELLDAQAGPWLLVIDDVDAPGDVLGERNAVTDGAGFLRPVQGLGLILVTTRDGSARTWGSRDSGWFRLHKLDPLTARDGAQILLETAGEEAGGLHEACALAARLGGLPLALRLAGRYLAEARDVPAAWDDGSEIRTFGQYEHALSGSKFRELLGPIDEQAELDEKQARRLIGRTWELSLDLLERQDASRARPLLRLVSCFERAPLAYQKILSPDVLNKTVLLRGITPRELARTMEALAGLDLITITSDNGRAELSLHPLVREVGRQYVLTQGTSLFIEYFAVVKGLILDAIHGMAAQCAPEEWAGWEALAPHCTSHLRLADDKKISSLIVAGPPVVLPGRPAVSRWFLLADPGEEERLVLPAELAVRFLHKVGRYRELEETASCLLRWQRIVFGDLAVPTLGSEATLAYFRQYRGDYESAAKTYQKLASVLPRGDALTIEVRHNWAALLRDTGDFDGAQEQERAVLATCRSKFGDDHESTMRARHFLAHIDMRRGNYAEARRAYEPLLKRCRRVLGPAAPLTLKIQGNLALTLHLLGDADAAKTESRVVVAGFTEALGPEHPDTLIARSRHARIIADNGDPESAARDMAGVVESMEQVLGLQHPVTTESRKYLVTLQAGLSGQPDGPE